MSRHHEAGQSTSGTETCRTCQDALSDHLDGLLQAEARGEVLAHLRSCASCARLAEQLDSIRRQARALGPVQPPRDLWPGIRARLDEPDVVALPVARHEHDRVAPWRRVVRLTVPQLAAAGLVLALLSGAGVWALLLPSSTGPSVAGAGGIADEPERPAASLVGGDAGTGPVADADRGGAVEELRAIVDEARGRLDANTVQVLERNLIVIERAIAEARAALDMDPANAFLQDHLRSSEDRRRDYLEQARTLVDRSS
jgi:anti-sigma factor RsiW